MGGVVGSSCAKTLSEAEMCILDQTKAVSNSTVKSILSTTRFIVPIAETVGKTVNRAVVEYRLHITGEASTTVADKPLIMQSLPPRQDSREYRLSQNRMRSDVVDVAVTL